MYFKKMQGTKCYLSPIDPDDAPKYAAWLNDEEVVDNLSFAGAVIGLAAEKEILAKLAAEHNYAIVDAVADELIGNVGLVSIDQLNGSAEIGIFIGNKDYWGKGYGTEAMGLLLDYAFRKLNLRSIMLRTYSFNERALACYAKAGFKPAGRLRKALRRNRADHDIILMDILAEEFRG